MSGWTMLQELGLFGILTDKYNRFSKNTGTFFLRYCLLTSNCSIATAHSCSFSQEGRDYIVKVNISVTGVDGFHYIIFPSTRYPDCTTVQQDLS
jgi:hypothetical protein